MPYEPLTATQAPSRPTATPDPTRIRMVEVYTCPSCGNATNLRHCMGTVRNPHPERPVPMQSTIAIPAADVVDAVEALAAHADGETQAGLDAVAARIRTAAQTHHHHPLTCGGGQTGERKTSPLPTGCRA